VKRGFIVLLVWAVACGPAADRQRRGSVRVAAAADLNAALGELIGRFSASHAIDVSATYGSSGTFFAQLMNGAPFDVFLSADVEYPRRLAERGLVLDGEFPYAVGRIVLWVPSTSTLDVKGGLGALSDPAVTRIAVANPEHAPYGRAAVAALKSAGVYEAVKTRLVFGENVGQALQFAQSGAADVGLLALSLVLAPALKDRGRWFEIPPDSYPKIEQAGAILRSAADASAARAFRAYLLGPEGRSILQQYGFSLPGR